MIMKEWVGGGNGGVYINDIYFLLLLSGLQKPTKREKGPFLKSRLVLFWYFLISMRALVPGRNLLFLRGEAPGAEVG